MASVTFIVQTGSFLLGWLRTYMGGPVAESMERRHLSS